MQLEKKSQYYLKRARATAKEIEFRVPDELKAKKDVDIDELFPVAIACIADLSSGIIRQEIPVTQIKQYSSELYFASKFYDAYIYINDNEKKHFNDNNYFFLVGAIAYYLCDLIGSSKVLAERIEPQTLALSYNKLDVLLFHLLNNSIYVPNDATTNIHDNSYISSFIDQYNRLMTEGIEVDYDMINSFRDEIYSQRDFRDIFFIDALLAIYILKTEYSIFSMLPMHSSISKESLVNIVKSNHFVRELWPSQRIMCENGLFNGKSGVIQMPTGAGKTKALSIAIYSSFSSDNTKLSIVVAPFRALCREIYDDLKSDLSFDENIRINQISDLLQIDYVIEELFNPNKKTVVVTTPEKLLYILRQDDSIINDIGQLIFDEGHLFDDEERGANYELLISSIISELNPETQKILISAIINNVDEINSWFTSGNGATISGESMMTVDKLPSVLKWERNYCYLYFLDKTNKYNYDFYVPRMIDIISLKKKKGEWKQRFFPDVNLSKGSMNEKNDMSIACLLKVVTENNAAIFCGTRIIANSILKRIIELNDRGLELHCLSQRAATSEIHKLSRLIEVNYGIDNHLYKASVLGAFAHHAGVAEGIKSSIEFALRKGLITNVICTSTLAQGVNLPIKYLIVASIYQANEIIKVRDFQNLIGRTARSGMFTEGTIIISDPFVFNNKNNDWKWRKYIHLLEPLNSEKCGSSILEIIKTKVFNEKRYNFHYLITTYYNDRTKYNNIIDSIEETSENQEELKHWIDHVINVLGKIECFISLALVDLGFSEDFTDTVLKHTLAYSLANDAEKEQLRDVFKLICNHVINTFPDSHEKAVFSRSLISIEVYTNMKAEMKTLELNEIGKDELLTFSLQMIWKYCSSVKMHKYEKQDDVVQIAKLWMQGESYYSILQHSSQNSFQVYRGTKLRPVEIDDITSVCDSDFGYTSSVIINTICEIISLKESEESTEAVETLKQIMQCLKYGLSDRTAIFIYELGFNDRYLAQEIAKMIGTSSKKSDAREMIKKQKNKIKVLLNEYPSVYIDRIENL